MAYKLLIPLALAAAVFGLSREAKSQGIEIEQEIRRDCNNNDANNDDANNTGSNGNDNNCEFTQEELEDICNQFLEERNVEENETETSNQNPIPNPCEDNMNESQAGRPVARINRNINNTLQFAPNLDGMPYMELMLDGSASYDPDGGEIQRYRWVITSNGVNGERRSVEYNSRSITIPAYISQAGNVNEINVVLHVWDDEGLRSHRARDNVAFVYSEREIHFVERNDDGGNNENNNNSNENGDESEQEAQQIELSEQDRQLLESVISQLSQLQQTNTTDNSNNTNDNSNTNISSEHQSQPLVNVAGRFGYNLGNHIGEDGYFTSGDTTTIAGSLTLNPNVIVNLAGINPFLRYERTELVEEPQVETPGFESLQINDSLQQQWQIGLHIPLSYEFFGDILFDGRSSEFSADGTNRLGEPITRDGNRNYDGVGVDLGIFELVYPGATIFYNVEDSDLDNNGEGIELRLAGNTGNYFSPFGLNVSLFYNSFDAGDSSVPDNVDSYGGGLELCYNLAGISESEMSGLEVSLCGNLGFEEINAVQGNRAYDHFNVNGGLSIEFDYSGLNPENTGHSIEDDTENNNNTNNDQNNGGRE